MLIVVCGEDTSSARVAYTRQIDVYKQKGFRISELAVADIELLLKNGTGQKDLFGSPEVFILSRLSTGYKGRKATPLKNAIMQLAADKTVVLIDWEEGKSAYELSSLKKIATTFLESKPSSSVFQLLDLCVPGKLTEFVRVLRDVEKTQDVLFIYTLLCRHIRKLILAQEDIFDSKIAPWQKGKLSAQAKVWKSEHLIGFYDALTRIDVSAKTSTNVFDVLKSLELLACYFLV